MIDLHGPHEQMLDAAAGAMQLLLDAPPAGVAALGVAIVTHPQPLLGGNAHHKVPQVLARGLAAHGWRAVRPNFRGVGASAGVHDHGDGETEDILRLVDAVRQAAPGLPLALVGFSFGAYVQARVARRLADAGAPADRVALAGMPSGDVPAGRRYRTPDAAPATLVVHGELDESVPLASVLQWARPTGQPVVVVPGADHFFSGRLPLLRSIVLRHLATPLA